MSELTIKKVKRRMKYVLGPSGAVLVYCYDFDDVCLAVSELKKEVNDLPLDGMDIVLKCIDEVFPVFKEKEV